MNRPEKKNALSSDMLAGLVLGYEYIDDNDDVTCAILTGAGGNFCSGMDLASMGADSPTTRRSKRSWRAATTRTGRRCCATTGCRKPLIAAVEGYAVAGGTEILQGTDIRVAGESAIFGVWEAKRGLFPLGGSACRLPRQIPYTIAMDILLRCPPVPAPEAKEIGLIGHVVPDGQALTRAKELANEVAQNGPLSIEGDPARVARDRAHERQRRDAAPGHDRLGSVRERGRARRPEGLRREAQPVFKGK